MNMRQALEDFAAKLKGFPAASAAATSMEYAILAMIGVAVIAAVMMVGGAVLGVYKNVTDALALFGT